MAANQADTQGTLRIIGGQWRGRRLPFTAIEGLRPTPDRVRETLFNWLAPSLHGCRCLDLFAGSGALGLEALSRGAARCQFVERSKVACDNITGHLNTLNADNGNCLRGDALTFLEAERAAHQPYQIAFLDPPFSGNLWQPTCTALEDKQWLESGSLIYIESARRESAPEVPVNWQLYRDKQAGGVRFQLFVRN